MTKLSIIPASRVSEYTDATPIRKRRHILTLLPVCLLLLCFLTGCSVSAPTDEHWLTDDTGRDYGASSPARVAVCSGSLAEIWQLAGGELAAVTEDAFDQPELNLEGVTNLGSVKEPNLETLISVEPDIVILSSNIKGHYNIRETLDAMRIESAMFEVETFTDYLRVLEQFTRITGRADLYEHNGAALQSEVDRIISVSQESIAESQWENGPRVLLVRAYSTGVKAKGSDTMVGAMLRDLGCINIADDSESILTELSMEKIIEEDPDFIFLTTMGSSTEAAIAAFAESFMDNPAWQTLSAVQNGRFIVLEKELFHLKPNARWPESYRILCRYLYGKE